MTGECCLTGGSQSFVFRSSGLVEHGYYFVIRHPIDFRHTNERRLTPSILDLLREPLKALILRRVVRQHVTRGLELDRAEFSKLAPKIHPRRVSARGQPIQKQQPGISFHFVDKVTSM